MQENLSPFAESIFRRTYAFSETETWTGCAARVAKTVANTPQQERKFFELIRDRVIIPGGRYLYSAGRQHFRCSNCFGFVAGDSREQWAQLLHDATLCLSTGGGLGVNYSSVRGAGSPIKTHGGTASGPLALAQMINEVARWIMAGGKRRSALWGGLSWNHPDSNTFLNAKRWDKNIMKMKSINFEYPAPLDMTNISIIIDDQYLRRLEEGDPLVWQTHYDICASMCQTGEPGLRNLSRVLQDDDQAFTTNACTEISLQDSEACNLMSIILPRIRNLDHMEEVTRTAIQFLYNGSIKAVYPTEKIAETVRKNRRLGLGIMGLHEFMMMNEHKYEWFQKLETYLKTWKEVCDDEKVRYAGRIGGNVPINTRAWAPNGTISILGQTTSGVEPVFCVAYRRRYIDGGRGKYQFVVDPTVKRLIELGIDADSIEDAYSLSKDIDRRLDVHLKIQQYTDGGISNTINLPEWGTDGNDDYKAFAHKILKYLPHVKGLTVYPANSRPGQPLTPVSIQEALRHEGVVFEETGECMNGVCGL